MLALVKRLQQCLDRQAEALEERSPKIKTAREEIAACLESMERASAAESARLAGQLAALDKRRAAHNARAADAQAKRGEAESKLEEIDKSEDKHQLDLVEQELGEIDKQMQLLAARQAELLEARAQRGAALETRRVKWLKILAALKEQPANFDETELQKVKNAQAQIEKELVATAEGRALWAQTCRALEELDARLGALEVGETLVPLRQTASVLSENRDYAESKNWRPLVTAIQHEHTVLLQVIDAVQACE